MGDIKSRRLIMVKYFFHLICDLHFIFQYPICFWLLIWSQVEVLWSRGTNKLEPLFPLLVKGRNLYKLKTFRQVTHIRLSNVTSSSLMSLSLIFLASWCCQVWKNEKERTEVLAEKHRRGNAARIVRATRREKSVMRKNKPSPSAFKGKQAVLPR